MQTPDLFTPLGIGRMTIAGRYIRSGTSESASTPEGQPQSALADMYAALARGGCPLIVTGYAYVRADGRSSLRQNAIHDDALIPHWSRIIAAAREANPQCRIAMQIVHGGRQCHPDSVAATVAPSAVPDARSGVTPRELREPEIIELIEAFGHAARRVKEAGFDAVQLHAAHGYLIAQFNSPHTNRRTDAWGGTVKKRARFLREVLARSRAAVGPDFPILVKINAEDCLPGGLMPDQSAEICRALISDGIDGIELSAWIAEADPHLAPSRDVDPAVAEEGYFLPAFREVRGRVPRDVPLGVCGGYRSLESMNRAMREEGFDFLAAARPFIAEPDIFSRLQKGQPRSACNACNECIERDKTSVVYCPPAREGRLGSAYLDRRIEP
jgi:2,4-dienoyl-CoA reductase-like NADH-dependent reductase (Old Yellow Enzyme family)